MTAVKQLLLKSLLIPGLPAFLKYVVRDCASIFMLHRFRDVERGTAGCDISQLRRALTYLTRNNYELVTLVDLFERLSGKGPLARGAVAFTIDDGYVEQATVAAPVFAEFGCPVTTFVCTGFLDGKLWFWWDQIEYIFQRTVRQSVQVRVGATVYDYRWENEEQRNKAQAEFTVRCKGIPEAEKWSAVAQLGDAAGVELPNRPPPHCAPMSWDQLRACERRGMTFGPHTVTHPVLSRTTDDMVEYEISECWARLRAEAQAPVPIFCYPNGEWNDFGRREIAVLHRKGFMGAVASEPGYANALAFRAGEDNRFKVQRFGFPGDLPYVIQYVSGVERFKQILRRST